MNGELRRIYLLTNIITNKVYVGQTKQTLEKRADKNGRGYVGCTRLYNSIKHYGWENFKYTQLTLCFSEQDANEAETFFIKLYRSDQEGFGYNIESVGIGRSAEAIKKGAENKRIKKEREYSIIYEYQNGIDIWEIEDKFKTSRSCIYRILSRNNIQRLNNFTKWSGKTHNIKTKNKMSISRTKYWASKKVNNVK